MLKITVIELLLRAIPEAFLFILGNYAFANKNIEKKTYFTSSILLAISTYLIRMLPIHFGVHTIIFLIIYILITTSLNNIPIAKAISSSMVCTITLAICESLNILFLEWLKVDVQVMSNNPLIKMLYFIPSLALFSFIVLLFYVLKNKNKKEDLGNVFN